MLRTQLRRIWRTAHRSSFGSRAYLNCRGTSSTRYWILSTKRSSGFLYLRRDDLIRIRGRAVETTRDNVIFELGLFVGRLGRERTFIIMPQDIVDLHLPSDLLGISTATFAKPENPRLLVAALGAACNKVRRAIQNVSTSNRDLGDLDLALSLAVPEPQQKHLMNLAEGKTKGYEGRGDPTI